MSFYGLKGLSPWPLESLRPERIIMVLRIYVAPGVNMMATIHENDNNQCMNYKMNIKTETQKGLYISYLVGFWP